MAAKLLDIRVVSDAAVRYIEALAAVAVDHLIVALTIRDEEPLLIHPAIAGELLDIRAIRYAAARYIETLAAVAVHNERVFADRRISQPPVLVRSAVAGELLDIRVVSDAAVRYVETLAAVAVIHLIAECSLWNAEPCSRHHTQWGSERKKQQDCWQRPAPAAKIDQVSETAK